MKSGRVLWVVVVVDMLVLSGTYRCTAVLIDTQREVVVVIVTVCVGVVIVGVGVVIVGVGVVIVGVGVVFVWGMLCLDLGRHKMSDDILDY